MKKRIVLHIGFVFLFISSAYSQKTIKEYTADGDKYYSEGKYYPANEAYWSALKFDTTNAEIAYKYAESLSRSLNFCEAKKWYAVTIEQTDTFTYPQCLYKMAIAKKNCGNYQEALVDLKLLKNHLGKIPEIAVLKREINHEIKSVLFALSHINDTIIYSISHLPAPINTTYSEFNPVMISGNKLVYSSYSQMFTDSFQNIFSQFYVSNIMVVGQSEQGWGLPKYFDEKINSTRWFTANICFSDNYRKAYFTRCYDSDGRVGQCQIYSSDNHNGRWSKPKKLPSEINASNSSSTQPFLVEGQEYEILYFVSNRKGGFGKNDIWYSVVKNGKYSAASNLGSIINTIGNEMTPNYNTQNQVLYFSSDYHEGFGGFDIFRAKGGLNQWEQPVNMGLPINSENNDLYFSPIRDESEAYFSSNRLGSFTNPTTTYCCGDIYYVSMEKSAVPPPIEVMDSIPPPITVEQKIKKLLPITLYFDNDIPDPNTTLDTTNTNYKNLLDKYFIQKSIYEEKYSFGLEHRDRLDALDTINDFFENAVGQGFRNLESLTNLLRTELDSGKNVSIKVKGYASPLNTSEYNYHLSKRRIASLINYLYAVDSGYFRPYLQGDSSGMGSLTIYQDPRGDKNAAPYVSENPNDKRNSVYSKAAALERRIQITMYSAGENDANNKELPVLQLDKNIYNLGIIKKGQVKTGLISFKNTGESELKIEKLLPDCPCVQLQMKKVSFAPKEDGKIYFLVKTDFIDAGKYKLNIVIKSNASQSSQEFVFNFEVE